MGGGGLDPRHRGERGQPGNYRAVFTNVGGGLKELRSGRYYDHAGLGVAEKDDWKHWWPLVGNTAEGATQTPTSFALNTLPNSAELGRADVPLERELWSMRVLGSESAPEGVEFTLSPGTGVTFVKRLRFVPHADQLTLEVELRNDVLATASTPKTFNLTPVAWTTANSGDSYYLEPQAAVGTPETVDSALAADGISEVIEVFIPRMRARGLLGELPDGIRLEAVDTGGAWVLGDDLGHIVATLRGRADRLLLHLWKRVDETGLTWSGNAETGRAVLAQAVTA